MTKAGASGPGNQATAAAADEENLTPMQKKQLEQERRQREAQEKKQQEKERKIREAQEEKERKQREAQEKKEKEQQEKERKAREAQEKKDREKEEKEKKRLEQEAAKEAKKNKNNPPQQEEKQPVQVETKQQPVIEPLPLPLPQPDMPIPQTNYQQQQHQVQNYPNQEQGGYDQQGAPYHYDPYYDQYPDEEEVELESHYQPAQAKRPPQQQKYNNQPAAPRRNNQTQKAPIVNRNYQNRSVDFDNFSWPTPPVSQSKKPAPRKPVSQPVSSNFRNYHSADEGHYYNQYRKQMVPVAPPKPPPRKPKPKKSTVKPTPVFELTPRMDLIAPNVKKHNQSSFAANPSNSYKEQYYATVTQGTVSTKPINPYDGSQMDKPAPPRTKPRNDLNGMSPYTRFPPLAMSMDAMANPAMMAYHPAYAQPGYDYDRLLHPYNLMYMDPYRNGMIPNQNVRMMNPPSYEPYTIKDYKNLKSNMQEKKSMGHDNFNPKVKQDKYDKMNKRKEAGDIFMKSNNMGRRSPETTRDKGPSQRTSISDRTSYSDVLGGNDFMYNSNALDNYNYRQSLDLTNYGLGSTNYNSLDYLNLNTGGRFSYTDNLIDLPSTRLVSDVNSRYNFGPPTIGNPRQYGMSDRGYDRNDNYDDYQQMPRTTNRKPSNNNQINNMPQNSRTRVY